MEIISIEKKTFEELVSRLGQFVKRMDSINRQRGGRRMSEWMDNQDVCQALKISPRTLQNLRYGGDYHTQRLTIASTIAPKMWSDLSEIAIMFNLKFYAYE